MQLGSIIAYKNLKLHRKYKQIQNTLFSRQKHVFEVKTKYFEFICISYVILSHYM